MILLFGQVPQRAVATRQTPVRGLVGSPTGTTPTITPSGPGAGFSFWTDDTTGQDGWEVVFAPYIMRGTDSKTGKPLEGVGHLRQSMRDILTTPLGSRVMRRDYGSRLFELIDAPLNASTMVELYAATAEALVRWEPRLRVDRVQSRRSGEGKVEIDVEAIYLPTGEPVFLEGLSVS